MKLDYLQFLELEMFTRFGAKLEAAMQATINRGRLLREILKQDRLVPLPVEFEMAWLVAFNNGLFDQAPIDEVPALIERLLHHVLETGATLDLDRDHWSQLVSSLFQGIHNEPAA